MPVSYVVGDATQPNGDGPKIIVHVCNDIGGWGAGFVLALSLSRRWSEPEESYRRWYKDGGDAPFGLGQVQFVEVEPMITVANLIGQHGLHTKNGAPPVRYEAIRSGLGRVAERARQMGASVHMPRIGCGLAGGRWEEVGPIVEEQLVGAGVPVTVYDFK